MLNAVVQKCVCSPRVFALLLLAAVPPAAAQEPMYSRDNDGRVALRAVHLPNGLQIDGTLDEDLYRDVPPITDFVQLDPVPGTPSSEKTEVWIAYDDENVYVSVRCWDSTPESNWVANEMRRDSGNVPFNENVAWFFDTFLDKRNALIFQVTPIGGVWDGMLTNERSSNSDWNPVWSRKSGRFEGGWTVESAIPFKSLRYRPGATQTWGFNMRRSIRWKHEEAYMTNLPLRGGNAVGALYQISNGSPLTLPAVPSGSKNLEIKPYALAQVTSDVAGRPTISNNANGEFGLDVKYGLTQNLTADFTYNTDFAQVEVDTQQVNLTRFSLFFPEKREFFLEGEGVFNFGGSSSSRTGGAVPLLFFSRRIGLNQGQAIPIDGGARLTGKIGRFTVGAIDVQVGSDDATRTPATNFSVLRIKRDILRRSSIGAMATHRSVSTSGAGASETFGADAAFGLTDFVTVNTYWATTRNPGVSGDDDSYRLQAAYSDDRYGVEFDRVAVGDNFNPEVGFLQRDDFTRTSATARFSPRPTSMPRVRKLAWEATYDQFANGTGLTSSREVGAAFRADFQSSDTLGMRVSRLYELIESPFTISRGVTIPMSGYSFQEVEVSAGFGNQRRLSGTVSLTHGTFYSGERTALGYNGGRLNFTSRFSFEPSTSINWVDLPQGSFRTVLVGNRATFTVSPLMFFSGIVQLNSSSRTVSSNLRFRWEYQPGSELFVVYTDERNTQVRGFPDLRNRAFVVKVNRLLRF